MLRFRLGSIPVTVHPSHLLVSAVLGLDLFATGGGADVPMSARLPGMVSWMAIVFVSVLVHELGHALVSLAYGYQPTIELVALGGVTRPNAPGPIPWHRNVLLTAAGPLFGLLLAVASMGAIFVLQGRDAHVPQFLRTLMYVNFFWTFVNLLPVLPLDGGQISSTLATRIFGPRGFIAAQVLALLVCAGVVLLGLHFGFTFLAVFFGMYGFQALRILSEAFRRTSDATVKGPHAETLAQAQAAMAEGRMDDARRLGLSVLDANDVPAEARGRAHYLLGWVALKEGKGRPALDHFSQVHGQNVEAHALAAAFSLVGDDARAVTLWEMAWRETGDRTVMHEFAGCLIRLGKVQAALRLPGVEPAGAFTCAERVLFIRGAYSEAAAVGEEALRHVPDPRIAYDAACAFARARNEADAVRLLRRASELGYRDAAYAASDEDLAPLHGHPGFEEWLAELRQSAAS